MLRFKVETDAPKRADLLCLEGLRQQIVPELQGASRAQVKRLFQNDQIKIRREETPFRFVNASELLGPGQFEFEIASEVSAFQKMATPAGPDFTLPVLLNNPSLLALNKRSGVPSVPHSSEETTAAVSFALKMVPEIQTVGRSGLEPGILHRLDTGTSGVLLFAKTQDAFLQLQQVWKDRQIRKVYRALVRPTPGEEVAPPRPGDAVNWPIGHDLKSPKRMLAVQIPGRDLARVRGTPQPALTRILKWPNDSETTSGPLDVCVEIETGVMHQIRVHLASLGFPIQGDPIYGGTPSRRLWLHAWKLVLPALPGVTDTELTVEAPLPEGWPATKKDKAQ